MPDLDRRFYRALLVGAAAGATVAWVVMTGLYLAVTDAGFRDALAFSAVPAFFCGPFLGGLATTAALDHDLADAEVVALPELEQPRAA